jgi:hypothetical protein
MVTGTLITPTTTPSTEITTGLSITPRHRPVKVHSASTYLPCRHALPIAREGAMLLLSCLWWGRDVSMNLH